VHVTELLLYTVQHGTVFIVFPHILIIHCFDAVGWK